ncbi:unnamed protein product [Protopolystoma xenopodis]|uniref:Uncharacterized protein n=1 Tax=Protopolystoma xenopodis TaxID=117903 RepID=A0A3S5C5J7_9PLAT|nr:unnamed protein product [Protopolystoma xenopodis]
MFEAFGRWPSRQAACASLERIDSRHGLLIPLGWNLIGNSQVRDSNKMIWPETLIKRHAFLDPRINLE